MRRFAPLILLGFRRDCVGRRMDLLRPRLKQQAANAPAKPKKLAPGLSATFHGWTYSHTSSQKTVITMHADDFQELDGKDELTGVTLDIYNKDGNQYDHVKSAKAEFDVGRGNAILRRRGGDHAERAGERAADRPADGRSNRPACAWRARRARRPPIVWQRFSSTGATARRWAPITTPPRAS